MMCLYNVLLWYSLWSSILITHHWCIRFVKSTHSRNPIHALYADGHVLYISCTNKAIETSQCNPGQLCIYVHEIASIETYPVTFTLLSLGYINYERSFFYPCPTRGKMWIICLQCQTKQSFHNAGAIDGC